MSAPTELKKSRVLDTINETMPSRATYYNSQLAENKNSATVRYDGFLINRESAAVPFNVDELKIQNEEVRQDLTRGNPDILPSGATLKMLKETCRAPEKPFESDAEVSFKVNAKGKFIFTIYAIMVLSLILVIVLNAIVINRSQTEKNLLQNQIAMINANISELNDADLTVNTSDILSKANAYGMSYKEPIKINLDLPDYGQTADYQISSNWFDNICDFFN